MSNTPKKIIFILPALNAGGAERVLITLMNNLDRTKFTPEFIAFQEEGHIKHLIASDVKIHSIGNHSKVYFGLFALLKKLKEIKPDIVMTTMAHTNFAILLLQPFLKNTKIIIREAITLSFFLRRKYTGFFIRKFYQWLYPRADLIISPSSRILREVRSFSNAPKEQSALLYNPVNLTRVFQSPLKKKEDSNKLLFICAGRLHYQKGYDRLIKALSDFNPKHDWELIIFGEGSQYDELQKMVYKYGLEKNIILYGYTDRPWSYVGSADAFLLPSRAEGLPNAVLESLAVGTPVIAMKEAGGIREIQAHLDDESLLTAVSNMEEFIDAMMKLTPVNLQEYRDNKLPETFKLESIMKQFEEKLDQL